MRESHAESQLPVIEVVREQPRNVLVAMGGRLGDNVIFYIFEVFTLTYIASQLGLPESLTLIGAVSIYFAPETYGRDLRREAASGEAATAAEPAGEIR